MDIREQFGRSFAISTYPLAARIAFEESKKTGDPDFDIWREIEAYQQDHGAGLGAFHNYVHRIELLYGYDLRPAGMFLDFTYTAPDDILLIAVRDGKLNHWTLDRPVEEEWTTYDPIDTEVEGVFRIMRAGDAIYLIDGDGVVYSAPGPDHQQVGRFSGWGQPGVGESPMLIEDHIEDRFGAISIVEGLPVPLQFVGDDSVLTDIISDISDQRLIDGLTTLTGGM